jgi:dimethylamine/trimethylamine dehydrogenase
VAPRLIAECIFDGHQLARNIDGENPHSPTGYQRERWSAPVALESAEPSA